MASIAMRTLSGMEQPCRHRHRQPGWKDSSHGGVLSRSRGVHKPLVLRCHGATGPRSGTLVAGWILQGGERREGMRALEIGRRRLKLGALLARIRVDAEHQ